MKKPKFIIRIRNRWRSFIAVYTRLGKALRWAGRILMILIMMDIGYMIGIWPEWKWYVSGEIPKSRFIQVYEREASHNPTIPRLRWSPVPYKKIPTTIFQAVLAAEDARFYEHSGIDTEAFQKAMEYNWKRKQIIYGGSTISQQTVKNLFLSGSRNPFRKLNELVLTFAMERNLKKKRILEIYLNIAEFGEGIYGVEAAARRYFGVPASRLTLDQAIELAATLPAPKTNNPKTRSKFFMNQRAKIMRNMGNKSA